MAVNGISNAASRTAMDLEARLLPVRFTGHTQPVPDELNPAPGFGP